MASAEQEVMGKLDGRDPNAPNYPPLLWRGVSLYHDRELGESNVTRPQGADPGKTPGELWWTVSTLDEATALAETLTPVYHGNNLWQMVTALFALHVEGKPLAEVQKALGISAAA